MFIYLHIQTSKNSFKHQLCLLKDILLREYVNKHSRTKNKTFWFFKEIWSKKEDKISLSKRNNEDKEIKKLFLLKYILTWW